MHAIEDAVRLDITDAATGGSRVCARMCSTCIYQPEDDGDRYPIGDLERDQWVASVVADDNYVVCHDSGPHRPSGVPAAICRGFWTRFRTQSLHLVLIDRFGPAIMVPPPATPAYPREAFSRVGSIGTVTDPDSAPAPEPGRA